MQLRRTIQIVNMPEQELYNEQPPPKRLRIEAIDDNIKDMDVNKKTGFASGAKRKIEETETTLDMWCKKTPTIPAEIMKAMPELYYYM